MSATTAPVASSSSHTNPRKRVRAKAASSLPGKHASSGHASTSTDSPSSPITVTSKRALPVNTDGEKKKKNSQKKNIPDILLPPDFSSSEEDELAQNSDDETLSELDRKQKSSQLTEKERKKIAMKRLKRARKDKGDKEVFHSPVYKSKLQPVIDKKGKGKEKAVVSVKREYDSEIDELASQQSDNAALAPMPWESDAEDELESTQKAGKEPVYQDEPVVKKVFEDLPPPLPQPELQWKRKARPPSRRDLFNATQQPAVAQSSATSFPDDAAESDEELPDLTHRSSAKSRSSQNSQPSTPQAAPNKERPRSATIVELNSPPRPLTAEVSPALRKSSQPASAKRSNDVPEPNGGERHSLTPERIEKTIQDLPPATTLSDNLYWNDASFDSADVAMADYGHGGKLADVEHAEPFWPAPNVHLNVARLAGPPASAGLEALIAEPMQQAAQAQKAAARAAAESARIAQEAVEAGKQAVGAEKQASAPEKIQEMLPEPDPVQDKSRSTPIVEGTPKGSQRPVSSHAGRGVIPEISSSAKRANEPAAFMQSPSIRHSQAASDKVPKGKGRAIEGTVLDVQHRPEITQVDDSDEEPWSDFDELELTQGRTQIQPPQRGTGPSVPNKSSTPSVRRKLPSPDLPAIPVAASNGKTTSSASRKSSSKAPSSEEESQACSYCGNIYPISALPTHTEACESAQEIAAASHAAKPPLPGKSVFQYSEGPIRVDNANAQRNTLSAMPLMQKPLFVQNGNNQAAKKKDLDNMLFGQPAGKARQTEAPSTSRSKGKARAPKEIQDSSSPDVPLRAMRSNPVRQLQNGKRPNEDDIIELEDDEDEINAHDWQAAPPPPKRTKPIRAPRPEPAGHGTPQRSARERADMDSSPPAGSIFLSKLPENVQQGYYRLAGLGDTGEYEAMDIDKLIANPVPLPPRKAFSPRGRGRGGRGGYRKAARRGTRSRKK